MSIDTLMKIEEEKAKTQKEMPRDWTVFIEAVANGYMVQYGVRTDRITAGESYVFADFVSLVEHLRKRLVHGNTLRREE